MNNKILMLQKIIRWIPLVNFITVFLWILTLLKYKIPVNKYLLKICVLPFIVAIFAIPRIAVDLALSNEQLYTIVSYVTTVLQLYVMSFYAVAQQDNILKEYSAD